MDAQAGLREVGPFPGPHQLQDLLNAGPMLADPMHRRLQAAIPCAAAPCLPPPAASVDFDGAHTDEKLPAAQTALLHLGMCLGGPAAIPRPGETLGSSIESAGHVQAASWLMGTVRWPRDNVAFA